MGTSKNDEAWEKLFEKYRILERVEEHGRVSISSGEINGLRGARLMTKFSFPPNEVASGAYSCSLFAIAVIE